MINNLNIMLPEIFLSLSIFSILLIGVFKKNSFNLIFNLTSLVIIITISIILSSTASNQGFSNWLTVWVLLVNRPQSILHTSTSGADVPNLPTHQVWGFDGIFSHPRHDVPGQLLPNRHVNGDQNLTRSDVDQGH